MRAISVCFYLTAILVTLIVSKSGEITEEITDEIAEESNEFVKKNSCYSFLHRYYYRVSDWRSIQRDITCFTTEGRWTDDKNTASSSSSLSLPCFSDLTGSCSHADNIPGRKYHWATKSKCSYRNVNFSLEEICHMLSDQTMMIVGDSITAQFGTSILNYISSRDPDQCNPDLTQFTSGMYEIKCPKNIPNFRIQVVRNDVLSLVKRKQSRPNNYTHLNNFEESAWIPLMKIINPSIVILNRGAHFVNTTNLIEEIHETISYITTNYPNSTIIWRTTPRGLEDHRKSFDSIPLSILPDPNRISRYPYAYEQFYSQNQAIKEHLEQYFSFNTIIWDAFYAMALREDGHRDPLHYCFPGPMDSWPYFLFTIINILLSKLRLYDSYQECNQAIGNNE